MIDIKKFSFIIFNFYVFSSEKPSKKPCSEKCSNKGNNEETILLNLKGKSGEQFEYNERFQEDYKDDNNPNKQSKDDKKFDFKECEYIQKSAKFYSLSSSCSSLILKIKQFVDVTTYQESLKNAEKEEDLQELENNLKNLEKKIDDLIAAINGKLNNVGLSLIDLDRNSKNILLNNYKLNELEDLNNKIDKKIQKYFEDKITPLKTKIGNYVKKEGVLKSEDYVDYNNYINKPDNEKNLKDYLIKIIDFEKKIYTVWKDLATLDELRSILNDLIKEIQVEISTIKDDVKKKDFTNKITNIENKGKEENSKKNNNGVKSCIDEVQKLKEDVKKVLDEEKKEKELEENIKNIEEITNSIQGFIDEFNKKENKEKYSNKITGDFTTEFNKLKDEKKELQKKSVNDLNKKQTDLSDLRTKIEEYKNLVDNFVKERDEINKKIDNLINIDNKQNYKDIIATYKSDIENNNDISKYSNCITNICKLFEKSDNIIKEINSLGKLVENKRNVYIGKIKNLDYSNLKSNTINDNYIKNLNNEIDTIFKDAKNDDKEALLEDYKNSIKFTIKDKGGDNEINVVELLKAEKSFTKITAWDTVYMKINKDIRDYMLGYINYRKSEKGNGSLPILNEIFKNFIKGKNKVDFNCSIVNIPKNIREKIAKLPQYKKIDLNKKKDEDVIFIYNLLRKLLLNIEIDYYNNKDADKYNKFDKNKFDINFVIPLDN